MVELLTIGEPLAVFASNDLDVSLDDAVNFRKYLAGAELNVAIGATRLGHSVTYLSRLGSDPLGHFVINALKNAQIDTSYIQHSPQEWTGFMMKQRVSSGDPDIYYYRRDSAASHFDASSLNQVAFEHVKMAHLTGIFAGVSEKTLTSMLTLIKQLHRFHTPIVFDPNIRPSLWFDQTHMIRTLNHLATEATIVMPGIREGQLLTGLNDPEQIADAYLNRSAHTKTVIIKLGPRAAFFKTVTNEKGTVPGFHVDHVVDTVGASDGFAVGVITGLLEHLSIPQVIQRGNAIGALAVQASGDNDGYPDRQELATFMTTQTRKEQN